MKFNIGYGFFIGLLLAVVPVMFFAGCETTASKQVGFEAAGYLAAEKAIEQDAENVERVQWVADAIDALLNEESILFSAVEDWYAANRGRIKLDAVELRFLELLLIEPAWEKLKAKYGGKLLDLQDDAVRADLLAFERGLRLAL